MTAGRIAAVIVAAGSGRRLGGDTPKQFVDLAGIPVLAWSARTFGAHPAIDELVVVLPAAAVDDPPHWLRDVRVVAGGATRAESVVRGVAATDPGAERLLVHDGVRPFVSTPLIDRVCDACARRPIVPVVPVTDTIKELRSDDLVARTLDRNRVRRAQTPQGFPGPFLRRLHEEARVDASVTDDAMQCELRGHEVGTVEGDPWNLKITTSEDLAFATWLIESGRVARP